LSEREASAVSLTKSQLHAGDQLSSVAGSTVMNVRVADVGLRRLAQGWGLT